MYERHPKKKDLVLVYPVVMKIAEKFGLEELKRIETIHEKKCKEWQLEPKWTPALPKWLEDRGWTEVKAAPVYETPIWDPRQGMDD